ncbi:hypothetical protein [Thalassobellus suaedae]|uniref:Uncharacterized protein n=1 Tax=Thalassobellus suaedae TaxID=3074124 RepID=A0ABY9XRM6_9FLAO|nr:hypothetical protein RHP51_16125 [Flavobacteriaceae bacterium HL-DH14]
MIHSKKEYESVSHFLSSKKQILEDSDLIVFEELYTFPCAILLYIITYGHKSLQIMHNVNKFLKRKISFNLKSIIAYLFFKIIKVKINGAIVISHSLKMYILNNKLFNKNLYYIPFADTNLHYVPIKKVDDFIRFTIPGTVNTERRNYYIFLKVFLALLEENPSQKVKLNLLGRIIKIGQEELRLIEEINNIKADTVTFCKEFIDQKMYHEELLRTNYLIGNINVNYTENMIKEVYGTSKETGVLFLMLQYNLQTLFPKQYRYSKIYKNFIIRYEDKENDLYRVISKLITSSNNQIETLSIDVHSQLVKEEIKILHKDFLSA